MRPDPEKRRMPRPLWWIIPEGGEVACIFSVVMMAENQPFLVRLSSPRNEPIGPNTLKPERNTGNGQLLLSTSLTVEIGFSKR